MKKKKEEKYSIYTHTTERNEKNLRERNTNKKLNINPLKTMCLDETKKKKKLVPQLDHRLRYNRVKKNICRETTETAE